MDETFKIIQKLKEEYQIFDWYQAGRFKDEKWVNKALLFTEDDKIFQALMSGAILENRFDLVEYNLNHHNFIFNYFKFVNTKKMADFLFNKFKGCIKIDLYKYPFLVGKCRVKPLSQVQKEIDEFLQSYDENVDYLIDCMKASIENTDNNLFDYLYQKYIDFGLNHFTHHREIAVEAFHEGNFLLFEKFICKTSKKDFQKLSKEDQFQISEYFRSQTNILTWVLEDRDLPSDVTKFVINKYLTPSYID